MNPLLHRQQELDLITAALDATGDGSAGGGSLTVVSGGIGLGKTALLRALPQLAERRGIRVLTASGAPQEQALCFGVLSQLLTPLLPAAGGTVIAPGQPADSPAGSGQDAELLALVAEHAEHKPLLLLVDDLQWADAASLRRLARLAGRLPRLRVTLVAALREGDPGEEEPGLHHLTGRAACVLRLRPLSIGATADLVGARLGRPVDRACARACHEATGGNPLLLTATLDALTAARPGAYAERLPDAQDIRGIRPDALRERLAVVLRGQRPPVWRFASALALLGEPPAPTETTAPETTDDTDVTGINWATGHTVHATPTAHDAATGHTGVAGRAGHAGHVGADGWPEVAGHAGAACPGGPAGAGGSVCPRAVGDPAATVYGGTAGAACAGAGGETAYAADLLACRDVEAGGEDPAARLAGLDAVGRAEAVRVLRRLGLLAEGPVPRFVHPVVADAVEEAMSPAEAEAARLRAALLLHQGGHPAERAAAQLLAVSSCGEPWAQEALRAAATAALRRTDPEAAVRYLRRALLLSPPDGAARADLLVELATIERDFAPRAALRHFTQALLLLPDPARRARVAGRIPPFLLADRPPATLDTVAGTAAALGDPADLTGADRHSALRLEARLRHAAVAGPAELADSAARLHALGPVPPLDSAADRERVTVLLHAAVLAQRVTAAQAVPLAERLLQHEPATPGHVHTALPLLTDVLVAADSLAGIGPWLHTAHDRARRDRATVPRALTAVELAHLALARGDLALARDHATEALDLGATDWAAPRTLAAVFLAALEARDTTLCERLLSGSPPDPVHCHLPSLRLLVRGCAAALRHDLPTALDCYLDWGRTAERAHWRNPAVAPWRSWASALHHRMGRPGQAHDLMDEEYERAVAWGSPVAIGRALRGRGAITGGERGLALLRDSAATLERSSHLLEQARTSLLLGRRLLTAGQEAEAEHRLTHAREQGLRCGAPWIADRAGRALHTIAGRQGADAVAALTRTERRVAGLAARGTSNRAIAERLEVSARAVEKHLTHAYRKLRIDGRAELAPMAQLLSQECP
ncbi:AAA family ATPase [Streptomyces sp. NPDC052077]|uniref:helix-turn-helix transcriptional regulator n=1 Tax=Streptomyces sp. NPDC052077 TaxID=3154757 RepID=UPI00341DE838